jgi:hypothetical protein
MSDQDLKGRAEAHLRRQKEAKDRAKDRAMAHAARDYDTGDAYVDIVLNLNRLTREGKLAWQRGLPFGASTPTLGMPKSYVATRGKKTFHLYDSSVIYASPTAALVGDPSQLASRPLVPRRSPMRHVLVLYDQDESRAPLVFPSMAALRDLYHTVETVTEELDQEKREMLEEARRELASLHEGEAENGTRAG